MTTDIGEVGIVELKGVRLCVHDGDEGLLVAGYMIGQGPGGVICRGDQGGCQEVVHPQPLPLPQIDPVPGLAGGGPADRYHLLQLAPFQHDQGRHHLGEAGRSKS